MAWASLCRSGPAWPSPTKESVSPGDYRCLEGALIEWVGGGWSSIKNPTTRQVPGGGGGSSMQGISGPNTMDYGTLDEPVSQTIMRDVRMVGNKMLCVLNPRKANIQTLKDWDLWGPLILCLCLATLLSWFAPYDQASLVFASVFVIIWVGAAVVTVNALLLGGQPKPAQRGTETITLLPSRAL